MLVKGAPGILQVDCWVHWFYESGMSTLQSLSRELNVCPVFYVDKSITSVNDKTLCAVYLRFRHVCVAKYVMRYKLPHIPTSCCLQRLIILKFTVIYTRVFINQIIHSLTNFFKKTFMQSFSTTCWSDGCISLCIVTDGTLTHWIRDKMAAILQTKFSILLPWIKMHEFRFNLHVCSQGSN